MKKYIISILLVFLMTFVSLYALPILSIVNVYPLPSKNITTIEYFQQIGTTNDITLKLYNTDGSEVTQKIKYSFETVINMRKKVILEPQNLPKGIYICVLKYNENSLSVKIMLN